MRIIVLLSLAACAPRLEIHHGDGVLASEVRELPAFTKLSSAVSIPTDVTAGATQRVEVRCDENLLADVLTTVEAGRLLLDLPQGENGTIQLDPAADCRVLVTAVGLASATASASGDVRLDGDGWDTLADLGTQSSGSVLSEGTLTAPVLTVSVNSSGDARIASIRSDEVTASDGSSGAIVIDAIEASTVHLAATSAGDVTVEEGTTELLTVLVSSVGDVHARGLVARDVEATVSSGGSAEVTATASVTATLTSLGNLDVWGDPPARDVTATGSGEVRYR